MTPLSGGPPAGPPAKPSPAGDGEASDALLWTGTPSVLGQLLERAPFGMAVIDQHGVLQSANAAYCRTCGYAREELLGHAVSAIFPPTPTPTPTPTAADAGAPAERADERDVVRRDRSVRRIITQSLRVPGTAGEALRFDYVVDITERSRAEQVLQASHRFTRSVLDGLASHICVIDGRGVLLTVNRAWREFAAACGGATSRLHEGANYLDVCETAAAAGAAGSDDARMFLARMHEVLTGQRPSFQLEYTCHSPEAKRWFIVRVSGIEGSEPPAYIVAHDEVTALELAQETLREMATSDELTGIANRRTFMAALDAEFARLKRHPASHCCVLAMDLDHFKDINDAWGHAAGDAALQAFAQVVSGLVRAGDVFGRTGGEEFTLLLPATTTDEAEALGERLRAQVATQPMPSLPIACHITVSIGIAVLSAEHADSAAGLRHADLALYEAKRAGRNTVRRWQGSA